MCYQIRVEKQNRGDLQLSSFLYCLHLGQFLVWHQGGNDVNLLLTAAGGGFGHIPLVPPSLFNVLAGVVHSLAM